MATKSKPVTAWAVFDPGNSIFIDTISRLRKRSIKRMSDNGTRRWAEFRKYGYTCRKIQITEVEK
jgi:hypothetical protein